MINSAAKTLTSVECNRLQTSNQHEFQGVSNLRAIFGYNDIADIPTKFTFVNNVGNILSSTGNLTWYDARRNNPNRSSEYRLYYSDNRCVNSSNVGDSLLITFDGYYANVIIIEKNTLLINVLLKALQPNPLTTQFTTINDSKLLLDILKSASGN